MADHYSMTFYVGHHDTQRKSSVTDELFHHAEDLGYDTLTTRITKETYQPKVLFHLSEHIRLCEGASDASTPAPPLALAPLTAEDTDLFPSDLAPRLLHLASPWIDLASPDPVISDVSNQVLAHEVSYAAFCGATNILISGPAHGADDAGLAQYTRAVRKALELGPGVNFQILLPMSYGPQTQQEVDFADLSRFTREEFKKPAHRIVTTDDMFNSWDVWHRVRTVCNYDPRLSIALTIPLHLPSLAIQNRWHSEPLRILHLPRSTFTPNKFAVDVLAKSHQSLISRYLRLKSPPWFLLSDVGPLPDDSTAPFDLKSPSEDYPTGNPPHGEDLSPLAMNPTPAEAARQQKSGQAVHPSQKPLAHLEYLRSHLQPRQPALSPLEQYGAGYQDFPQSPLQPLTDNLESVTYEVFEKDPIKYEWYERAILSALNDWKRHSKPRSWNNRIVIAVVGAGRGPLVQRALIAAEKAGMEVDIWAVEKNPSAFVHLHRRKLTEWGDKVHLCQSDMRGWKGPLYPTHQSGMTSLAPSYPNTFASSQVQAATVDILVSELLGSFADNELSPECLDGVQRHLQPIHGVSIPTNYTAHLTPIAAPRLWYDIHVRGKLASGIDSTSIPYVAWLHAIDYLSTKPVESTAQLANGASPSAAMQLPAKIPEPHIKETWLFKHPIPESTIVASNAHNGRFAHLTFTIPHRGVCHGLGGYFEALLYQSQAGGQSAPGAAESSVAADPAVAWSTPAQSRRDKIELSTHPLTMDFKSADMISWFPIFFPLKEPQYVPDNGELRASIWRQVDGRKVWYEWMIEVWIVNGTNRIRTGSSGLISSEKEGCLM